MKYWILFLAFITVKLIHAQTIKSLTFDELKSEIHSGRDTLLVLNFGATWCKPCIEEIPAFEKLNLDSKQKKIKVILINLDFNSKIYSEAEPFLKQKEIHSVVYHITDTNPNEWINQIDTSWSGAIPATAMYLNGNKKFFKEGSMNYVELKSKTNQINQQASKK